MAAVGGGFGGFAIRLSSNLFDVDQFKLGRLPALPPAAQAPQAGISKGAVVLSAFNTGTG
jgi:hypothetical protein